MRRRWSGLILGLLFTSALGCRSLEQDTPEAPVAVTPPPTHTAVSPPDDPTQTAAPVAAADPQRAPDSTDTPPALPAGWQYATDEQAGLRLAAPGGWADLSDHLTPDTAVTPYGILTLFAAASERTGATILNGKDAAPTALILGMITTTTDPPAALTTALNAALAPISPTLTLQAGPAAVGAPPRPGAAATTPVTPLPLLEAVTGDLRTRFVYFPLPETAVSPPDSPVQAYYLLLFTAPAAQWPQYDAQFEQVLASLRFLPADNELARRDYPFRVRGQIRPGAPGTGALERDVPHLWSLPLQSGGYLSLTLASPQYLDLGFTLYAPDGEALARVDNGFAGDAETLTDLPLEHDGRYALAVSEFNGEPGPYTLTASLSPEPVLARRGHIRLEQTAQTRLAPGDNHIWRFSGTAGQYVSAVLTPLNEEIDLILNVYDPEGERLVALDEGFSGDPEVAAGFQLPTTGDYSILITSFADEGGRYALALNEGGEATLNFYDAGDLLPGETMQETLRENEAHAWFFRATAEQSALIQATPLDPELDLDLWLLDPEVNRLAIQDKFLAGEGETLQRALPVDGQYLALVRDFRGNAGTYEISLMLLPQALPEYNGTLSEGVPGSGALDRDETAFWLFNGESDQVIDVRLEPVGENADLILTVQAPDGSNVLTVDNGGSGDAEVAAGLPLTADGQWRLLVREFLGETAAYTITVSTP